MCRGLAVQSDCQCGCKKLFEKFLEVGFTSSPTVSRARTLGWHNPLRCLIKKKATFLFKIGFEIVKTDELLNQRLKLHYVTFSECRPRPRHAAPRPLAPPP